MPGLSPRTKAVRAHLDPGFLAQITHDPVQTVTRQPALAFIQRVKIREQRAAAAAGRTLRQPPGKRRLCRRGQSHQNFWLLPCLLPRPCPAPDRHRQHRAPPPRRDATPDRTAGAAARSRRPRGSRKPRRRGHRRFPAASNRRRTPSRASAARIRRLRLCAHPARARLRRPAPLSSRR